MCTAAVYKTKDFYFGRTLDNDDSYGEKITVLPRNYCIPFRNLGAIKRHYAIIGTAHFEQGVPLFYDAVNEMGVGMAGLNFVGNAHYNQIAPEKDNIAVYEFIPWILSQSASVNEAKELLKTINLTNQTLLPELPVAQLHWIIADETEAITVESVKTGLHIYDNVAGVLTNNPPFQEQAFQLNNYMHISPKPPENLFSNKLKLSTYCRGMGGIGLPGDLSSQSRFIRAAFVKMNSVCGDSELESVSQFFHILGSVEQQKGCCITEDGAYETTIYTSCYNATQGIYYYTTYQNHQISAVRLFRENLEGNGPISYPVIQKEQIRYQN